MKTKAHFKNWRTKVLGFTQEDMGQFLGMDKNTIARYERGDLKLPKHILRHCETAISADRSKLTNEERRLVGDL